MRKVQFRAHQAEGMQCSKILMKGMVAKHIEHRNFFHGNDIHWKTLIVKLQGQPVLKLRDTDDDSNNNDKRFPLHTITAMRVYENEEVSARQEEKVQEQHRRSMSGSFISRIFSRMGSRDRTKFAYGFELDIGKRPFLFFVNTYEELVNWKRLFSLIIEMN